MANWPINGVDKGYLVEGSTADQSDGLQRLLNDGANGAVEIPTAITIKKQVVAPPCDRLEVIGLNGRTGPAYLAGPSKITVGVELAPTAAPHTVPAVDFSRVGRVEHRGIAYKLGDYQGFTSGGGICPTRMFGLRFGGSYRMILTAVEGFSSAVGLGGGTAYGFPNQQGFDHSMMEGCYLDGGIFAINLLPGSNAAGDMSFQNTDLYGGGASIAMAKSASSGMVGSTFVRVGSYAPNGFNVYDDGSGKTGGQLASCNLQSFSAEFGYDSVYFDDLYFATNGSPVVDNIWTPGFYQSPQRNVQGWGHTMPASAVSGNTVTVTPPPGFVFKPGLMTVADMNGDPGLPLATVLSNDGVWPYATIPAGKTANSAVAVPVTLTLDRPIDPAITSVRVNQVKLATIVCGTHGDDLVQGSLMRTSMGYPIYYAGRVFGHSTRINDGQTALVCARVAPLFGGKGGGINYWGNGELRGESRFMSSTTSCSAGDVLMANFKDTANDKGDFALQYDGSGRRPLGLAVRDAATGASVDIQKSVSKQGKATFNNKSTTATIHANALIGPDPVNKGGTIEVAKGDPSAFGVNDSHDVLPGAQGHPAELWF